MRRISISRGSVRWVTGVLAAAWWVAGCAADPKPPAPAECADSPALSDDTISDFESGTALRLAGGRNGAWYAYNDQSPTCVEDPAPGAVSIPSAMLEAEHCGSRSALRMRGMGCGVWGAGIGTDLAAPPPSDGGAAGVDAGAGAGAGTARKIPYDLGAFRAITFWGRAGQGAAASVRFKIPMLADTKIADGGSCQLSEVANDKCSDDWGRPLAFNSAWQLFTVTFDENAATGLTTEGWGKKFPLDLGDVVAIQFQVGANAVFDVWIDDVNLVRR